jgi:hypothetical protein
VFELTCQGSDVTVVPVDELLVVRTVDSKAGIAVNIPMTREAFALLAKPEVAAV